MIGFSDVYARLAEAYGPQDWWPADGAFEIMVGALLVQRTAWRNAELAVASLRKRKLLDPHALAGAEPAEIERCIRGAGFFRTKAARLQKLAQFVVESGGTETLQSRSTKILRDQLLALEGVGPETADAILLYGFERPVLVIDAYLRRIARRLAGEKQSASAAGDRLLRERICREIGDTRSLNEFHALVIAHARACCRVKPRCESCAIAPACASRPSLQA